MRILSIFLTLVVLITGVSSCADPIVEEPLQYSLTVSSSGGGLVITPGEDTFAYEEGAVVDLVATADDGYHFVEWMGDVDTVASVKAATTTITMEGDYSITANFAEIPPARYSLTVSSTTGGSVIAPGEGTFTYDAGTVVNLVTEAEEGWYFVRWTGDLDTIADVNAAETTITMNSAYSVTASFTDTPAVGYSVTVSSTAGGSVVEPGEGSFTYDAGSVVNLVAEAEEGYQFVKWTGDVGTIANVNAGSTTITMNGDYSITASFEEGVPVLFVCPNLEVAVREAIGIPVRNLFASDLEVLTSFSATGKNIVDLTGLEYCINLRALDLSSNQISDVSHLAHLTELEELHLRSNQIRDITHLADLRRLAELSLDDNELADVSPLLQNEGLGDGDVIYLRGNPLSWNSVNAYIPELRAAGVTVVYDEEGIPGEVIVIPPLRGDGR